MNFVKMNSFGNSFLLFKIPSVFSVVVPRDRIVKICQGLKVDGIVIYNSNQMRIFNRDGSEAETCGNALRCIAYLLNQPGINITVKTLGGESEIYYSGEQIRVSFFFKKKPAIIKHNFPQVNLSAYALTVGVPHLIVETIPENFREIAPILAKDIRFERGTNVNFIDRTIPEVISLITWERGVGFSLSCGTGAMAVGTWNFYQHLINSTQIRYGQHSVWVNYQPLKITLLGTLPEKVIEGEICLI